MGKIGVIENVDLADHAQILDGQRRDLALPQLVETRAFREDRDAHVLADQILDRRDVVDLEDDLEIVDRHARLLEGGDEEVPRPGVRQAQDEVFPPTVTMFFFARGWLFDITQTR